MNEMSTFWSWWVIILTVGNILACIWLIRWTAKKRPNEAAQGDVTGHSWDGDLQEYNNPLPRWWLWLFYFTIIFSAVYLYFYPGLGNYKGALGWTQENQYDEEISEAKDEFGPIFAAYAAVPIDKLAKDGEAVAVGQRLYLNYCAQCHGSAATGGPGFPNLADNAWLWGGSPDQIKTSIANGRTGAMPAWQAIIGDDGVANVTEYVRSLSGQAGDANKISQGKATFATYCAACHAADGTGNIAMGAPNLTDSVWVYGGSPGAVAKSISEGRAGVMPAHGEFLGDDKVHVLATYIYSLSN